MGKPDNCKEIATISNQNSILIQKNILDELGESEKWGGVEEFLQAYSITGTKAAILFFLDYMHGSSDKTLEVYSQYICQFFNSVRKHFRDVSHTDVAHFFRELEKRGLSASTINTAQAALKSFYRFVCVINPGMLNPMALVRTSKKRRMDHDRAVFIVQKALSNEEVLAVDAYIKQHGSLRDRIIFYLLARLGLRVSELASLEWGNIKRYQGSWVLEVIGKGDTLRLVVLTEDAISLLMVLYRELYSDDDVFFNPTTLEGLPLITSWNGELAYITRQQVFNIIKKYCLQALGRDVSPHDLRHTCFTNLEAAGISLKKIQILAGHKSIKTTAIYVKAGEIMGSAVTLFNEDAFRIKV